VPQRLFNSRRLDALLAERLNLLTLLDKKATRDEGFVQRVDDAAKRALVTPLGFDRTTARFDTQLVSGGVNVTLEVPYSGHYELLNCSTNGRVFDANGTVAQKRSRWSSSEDESEVFNVDRVVFVKRFDSTDPKPIKAWAKEMGDDLDRQATQQAGRVTQHNESVEEHRQRLLVESDQRAGDAEKLKGELGEGI
jgi:hypothetical protein